LNRHRDYSEATAEKIDRLTREIMEEQMKRARLILTEHKDQLENLAKALLEHEMLDREEIMKVISGATLEAAKKTRIVPLRAVEPGVVVDVVVDEDV